MTHKFGVYYIYIILDGTFIQNSKGKSMKKTIAKVALSSLLMSGALMAGKNVAPAVVPVVPVVDVNPIYVGLGLLWSGTSRDCDCSGDRLKNTSYGVMGRIGYDFNQYFGIEARAFNASIDKNFAETTHYGVYLKPQYHITDKLNVYGLIGYGQTKIECTHASLPSGTNLYDESGVSFGFGFEYDLSADTPVVASRAFDGQGDQEKGWGVWVDYQNLLHNEGPNNLKANIVTAGVTYDF